MKKTPKRVLAVVLALVMALSVFSISASAYNANYQSETHTVFKHTEQTLAPGVEFYKNYAYAKADGEQMVYYVTTADITRDDVIVQTSYKEQYKDGALGMQRLRDQVAFANDYYSDPDSPQFISEYYNVVSGCNASFYNMTTGQPTGVCFIDGVDFGTAAYPCFFAILKDGTAICDDRTNKDSYTGEQAIWQAVGGSQWIVRNGQDVTSGITGNYNTDRADRSCVGVTADGKVVIMSLDGRQIPYSCGGSMHEIAQIMLEAGCVAAINVDGGGSTTFMAKAEGEDSIKIVNRPSDGSDRAISSGIIIASTAAPSNVFSRATLTAENNYMTVNATQTISAKGISPAGTSADIPVEATLTTNNGTISADGVFVPAHVGDATIQMVYNNDVVGETVVHVVDPTKVAFNITTLAVPYGQSSEIDVHLYYGEFNYDVLFVPADLNFSISNPSFGQINGLTFTATSDTTVTGSATLTVASTANADLTQTIPLIVGKGSEVIFDFEDQDVSRWSGDDMYFADVTTTCTAVNAETGKVHSGDYALAYNMNFSQPTYYEDYIASKMCYNAAAIKEHGVTQDAEGKNQHGLTEDYVDITGAVGLGFWVYLPDEVAVNAFDPDFRISGKKTAAAEWSYCNGYMDEICDANGLLITNGDSNQEGWYYFHFDLSSFSSYYKLRLQDARPNHTVTKQGRTEKYYGDFLNWYITDAAWKKAGIKSYNSNFTLYIDDFTVDYSSVVPDREAPVFSSPTYAFTGASDALALNNGATIAANGIEFAVSVAENTAKTNASGLKAASVKAYVDGVEVNASYTNGKIAVPETAFANGIHTVMFEASDNTGNTSHMTRTFTVSGSADLDTIKVVPRNAGAETTPVGSLYYVDVVATDPSKIATVDVSLKVNNVNDWELEGVEAAEGFTATASLEAYDKGIVDLTITGDGSVTSTDEAVIASIPVRTWYPHNVKDKDSAWLIANKRVYPIDTQIHVKKGAVEFTDGDTSTFNAAKIQIDSEAMCPNGGIGVQKGDATSWHEHTAHAIADKDPSCTEDGYTGRTFCDECNSVVDWGTVVPATGHSYKVIDGVLKCEHCGEIFNGEYTDGKTYVDGVALNGFVDGKYYIDGVAQSYDGVELIDDIYYEFDNGTLVGKYTGIFEKDGKYYYSQLGVLASGWTQIEGDWYYFDAKTMNPVATLNNGKVTFEFEENGKLVSGKWYITSAGRRYFYGPSYYKHGWETIGGDEYYFGDANKNPGYCYTGKRYVINSNSYTPQWYDFGEEGKAVKLTTTGLLTTDAGTYYLVDGVSQGGLQKVGEKYYYFTGTYEAKSGLVNVSATKNNDLLPAGYYLFGDDYAMVDGAFAEWKGAQRWIVLGQPYFAGVMEDENGIYYIGSDALQKTGLVTVSNGKGNGILDDGTYMFGEDGYLTDNAFGYWQGKYVYFQDGQPYAAGPVEVAGKKYYIRSDCQPAKGLYHVSTKKANDILGEGYYLFDTETGAMVDGTFADWKGTEMYIKEGQPYFAGVVEHEGTLVYVDSSCQRKTGVVHITTKTGNGILDEGYYLFDENGLVDNAFGEWTNGKTYYFVNGQRTAAGVVRVDDKIYFINGNCQAATGTVNVTAAKGNGILEAGTYTFGADGVLVAE